MTNSAAKAAANQVMTMASVSWEFPPWVREMLEWRGESPRGLGQVASTGTPVLFPSPMAL